MSDFRVINAKIPESLREKIYSVSNADPGDTIYFRKEVNSESYKVDF